MPGPRMGPRPADFDEEAIKQSPTFVLWMKLEDGEKIRYACREFTKGVIDDEERLMRRIMIARRNNVKDHEKLKKARKVVHGGEFLQEDNRRRRQMVPLADSDIAREMDVNAVIRTRSYQLWSRLGEGEEFTYNQRYIKGRDGHDWLLRKNIWRRMRYRRQNKKIVAKLADNTLSYAEVGLKQEADDAAEVAAAAVQAASDADHHLSATDQAAIEAAVAAAETFGKATGLHMSLVHNPLEVSAHHEALDAAAKLAAHRQENDSEEYNLPENFLDDHTGNV